MAINKESLDFTLKIFNWCMSNGIKDILKIQELCELILVGMAEKESHVAPVVSTASVVKAPRGVVVSGNESELGKRYKSLRIERNLSQNSLAEEAGISAHAAREADFGRIAPHVKEKLDKYYGI